jgi:uncharacterized protein YcfJ
MKKFLVIAAAAAAFASFAPAYAQVSVETPVGGVRIGEPPRHEDRVIVKEREPVLIEKEVRGTRRDCDSVTVKERVPGATITETTRRCD